MIFLDNASTTQVFGEAILAMDEIYKNEYFNPSALYSPAIKVCEKINIARLQIAKRLNVEPNEIFFTSCATESNAWAVNNGFKNRNGNIVVSCGEHASIYANAMSLKNKGLDVRFAPLSSAGTLDLEKFANLIDNNTCFVSVIHCSNETGAINDLRMISNIVKNINPKTIVHSDGVQAFCKINNNCAAMGLDMYSLSAHKIGAPKGIGVLYIKKSIQLAPYLYGGGQERGSRSGTENVAGIVGFGIAVEQFTSKYNAENMTKMHDYMVNSFQSQNYICNATTNNSKNILSVSIPEIKSEILQNLLADEGILIGLGSACSSKTKNNRVLGEMGIPLKLIEGSIRISFGIDTTFDDVKIATDTIIKNVNILRNKQTK